MLAVILKILSILGIVLLIILGMLLLVLLLVLFLPIVYRIHAGKEPELMTAKVRVRWLFGLIRADFAYPEPGNFVVKVLWVTVYDSKKAANAKSVKENDKASDMEANQAVANTSSVSKEAKAPESKAEKETQAEQIPVEGANTQAESEAEKKSIFEKIRYTIKKIYDKIKHILDNILFYKELLQDEDTKLLVSHAWKRLCKILRNIRPRKLKADVLFGMDAPDTTGYIFALYGMLSPQLGKHVNVTPDFTQKILEGRVNAAGHITIFTLVVNLLAVLFDKRLQLLKHRLDAHKKKTQKEKE